MALNYDMQFGVSEVARMLKADRDTVKAWSYHLTDYLGPAANPGKGLVRRFSIGDLRVFAYISTEWEDEPDYESIKIGLNLGHHHEDIIDDFVESATPIIRERPEELDETWRHGTIIGGMAEFGDIFALAESYKLAGDILVDAAIARDEAYELFYPVIYNYRHAVELYLKASLSSRRKGHELPPLLQEFNGELQAEFGQSTPEWFNNIIQVFHDFDPGSVTFRYAKTNEFVDREYWADLHHIKNKMGDLANGLQKVRQKRGGIPKDWRL